MVLKTWIRAGMHGNYTHWQEVELLAAHVDLIYCGGGNRRFYETAKAHGFLYGVQLPDTVYGDLYFADQDWKNPDLARYAKAVAKHRPVMASVLDWELVEQLPEVLSWAETIAPFVSTVMLIPKVIGGVNMLPHRVGGKPVRLGYSVPTRHGGTKVPLSEFRGWPVHLLGGNPHKQLRLSHFLDVVSADGNMMLKMATQYGAFYDPTRRTAKGSWASVKEFDGREWGYGMPYEAFRRSCENIMAMWRGEPIPSGCQLSLFRGYNHD